jgi:beta-glucosidase-like glycosyl hydrolase
MKKGLKRVGQLLGLGGLLSILASPIVIEEYPLLQGKKHEFMPILSIEDRYCLPTTEITTSLEPAQRPELSDSRATLEEQVASLIIGLESKIGEYVPGGILLTNNQTREGHLFGRFSSYDAEETQESVESIWELAKDQNKEILIYDEGEGGYVMRIGTLPSAENIGDYYFRNKISGTIKGRVQESNDKEVRRREVQRLFSEYAQELHNRGVDAVLGPVLDVRDPNHKSILIHSERSFSSDFNEVQELAELYSLAMENFGIKTIGKHFLTTALADGDPHDSEIVNDNKKKPRIKAGRLYGLLGERLDGVMVTHNGNPSDLGRPYSLSRRAYQFLTQEKYPIPDGESAFIDEREDQRRYNGLNYNGWVIIDDVEMEGIRAYVSKHELSERGKRLVAGCDTLEARTVVLALDQGAQGAIVRGEIDPIVKGISEAYKNDPMFEKKIIKAIESYQEFKK